MTDGNQAPEPKVRAAFYIDGFNFYHALDALGQPHLKWLSYWKLCKNVLPQRTQELVGVTWCTARHPSDNSKAIRHDALVLAQKCEGVLVRTGHFVNEDRDCRGCGNAWKHPSEKEGDINVAINLLRDAFHNVYDHAYLLTADSDQVATIRMFKAEFPHKNLTVVVPPGRERSKHLHAASPNGSIQLNENHIDRAVMRQIVMKAGVGSVRRPFEYDPPAGWVHPEDRPK